MSGWEAGEWTDGKQTNHGWLETSASDPTHLCMDIKLQGQWPTWPGLQGKPQELRFLSWPGRSFWGCPGGLRGAKILTHSKPGGFNAPGFPKTQIKEGPGSAGAGTHLSLGRPDPEHPQAISEEMQQALIFNFAARKGLRSHCLSFPKTRRQMTPRICLAKPWNEFNRSHGDPFLPGLLASF